MSLRLLPNTEQPLRNMLASSFTTLGDVGVEPRRHPPDPPFVAWSCDSRRRRIAVRVGPGDRPVALSHVILDEPVLKPAAKKSSNHNNPQGCPGNSRSQLGEVQLLAQRAGRQFCWRHEPHRPVKTGAARDTTVHLAVHHYRTSKEILREAAAEQPLLR